jgi:hypothetical protein
MAKKDQYSRRFTAGRPRVLTTSRRSSSTLAVNYKMMLEIYCINKRNAIKKPLSCERALLHPSISTTVKPEFSISSALVAFFEESFLLLKKLKPRFAMATVSE